ncbi:hypothetical protein DIPPA_12143 [Diplonema papillatum]|nr:hypothetical protein DIPPA_12143 [Diplonema papillatum]KAJ9444587.1 hypothetical protein DIPPA_12143 [Diplonema papillatum]
MLRAAGQATLRHRAAAAVRHVPFRYQCRQASGAANDWQKWKEQLRQKAQENMAARSWIKEHGSPYATLGVEENASLDQVKAAYRKLSLTKHPDKGGSLEEFQRIQTAHNIIVKGLYGTDKTRNLDPTTKLALYSGLLGVAGLLALYIVVFLPLRWFGRKIGILSIPVPPPSELEALRGDVKKLQESVDKLQEIMEETREQTKRRRTKYG